jgi:hypothetical protein
MALQIGLGTRFGPHQIVTTIDQQDLCALGLVSLGLRIE